MSGLRIHQWGWRPHWLYRLLSHRIEKISEPPPSLSGLVFREGDSTGYAATLLVTFHGWGFCLYDVQCDDSDHYLIRDNRIVQGVVLGNFTFVPV